MNRYFPTRETTEVVEPELVLDVEMHRRLVHAERWLARLDLAGRITPHGDRLEHAYQRMEAVATCRMAEIEATLLDLLAYEAEGRLVGGGTSHLGDLVIQMETRRAGLELLLEEFDDYIHADSKLPHLVRAGLAHACIEKILCAPMDGGRTGRLLIHLLLDCWGLLARPLLYLSRYFLARREEYDRLLRNARKDGEWKAWCLFFLDGVADTAADAVRRAHELLALAAADRARLLADRSATVTAVRLLEQLPLHPIVTTPLAVRLLDTSKPTAIKTISHLERLGVLAEISGRRRGRLFGYGGWLELLDPGFRRRVRG